MTRSIKTFLLIYLLLSVTLIISISVIGSLYLEHRDLRTHLDAQLSLVSYTIQSLISPDIIQHDTQRIQQQIINSPKKLEHLHLASSKILAHAKHEVIQFQVFDPKNRLILHSPSSPPSLLYASPIGFSDRLIGKYRWRVFNGGSTAAGYKTIVAVRHDFREEIEQKISRDSIYILLITYPFLALLIWFIVGRGLSSLKRVVDAVKSRESQNLEPIQADYIPKEIKPLLDELNHLFERLQETFTREKRFAADAAHELRTPLAALKAQAQVVMQTASTSAQKEALGKVISGVDRSAHIVQQLLTLSRMVPESTVEDFVNVNIIKQATEVIAHLVPTAMEKNTEIELLAPNKVSLFKGYPTAIGILIRNLVDNAIRYTPEGSHVIVKIEETAQNIQLSVIDNGPGIPDESRTRVFERFYRVLGNKATGSGLGLGIVQQIAKLHRAKLALLTPGSGEGLEVMVSIPKQCGVR